MPAKPPKLDRDQQHQQARFRQLGLATRALPDGRSLLVSFPINESPFESIAGPLVIERVLLVTVGSTHVKCLRPRPLFGLPLIDIRDCPNRARIEGAIRQAWRNRTNDLRETRRQLDEWGFETQPCMGGSGVSFSLAGETPTNKVRLQNLTEAILPTTGPLSGLDLAARSERVVEIGRGIQDGSDLECLIGAQVDSARRNARKRDAQRRDERIRGEEIIPREAVQQIRLMPQQPHRPKLLLVGSKLVGDGDLRNELKRQGYRTATARSEPEALARLAGMTPDLVVSEFALGRSDGATLVQTTRAVAGIEGVPVVLIDDAVQKSRRDAARAVGAAGYVVHPTEKRQFVKRLSQLLEKVPKRRYTRYPDRLPARLQGLDTPCIATQVGRGGIFVATDAQIDLHSAMQCELTLPELGRSVRFEGEVLYRGESQGALPGLGVRFFSLSPEDEAALVEYVTHLEARL